MAMRRLYVVRHGAADASGELTDVGRRQAELLADRLAALPVDAVWHSPLARAVETAQIVAERLPAAALAAAAELVDHLPHVPPRPPPALERFFAGFSAEEVGTGARLAAALVDRFARPADVERSEVLVTHAFQVAWLVRHALGAPAERWVALSCGNAALTAIELDDAAAPSVLVHNDMGHLPPDLRWTGFRPAVRP